MKKNSINWGKLRRTLITQYGPKKGSELFYAFKQRKEGKPRKYKYQKFIDAVGKNIEDWPKVTIIKEEKS